MTEAVINGRLTRLQPKPRDNHSQNKKPPLKVKFGTNRGIPVLRLKVKSRNKKSKSKKY